MSYNRATDDRWDTKYVISLYKTSSSLMEIAHAPKSRQQKEGW